MTDLSRLLQPQSVAYLGGSQISGAIRAAQRAGFAGSLHVVNPNREHIEGVMCVPGVADLPLVPDAAVVGLSAERSITAVAQLSEAGCGGAVVMVSGFAELNTNEGRERQQRLIEAAGSMPLLGPNCMGLMNQFSGAFVWGDDNHCERQQGPAAAIISQSGALLIGMTGVEVAFPLGYAVSVGNQSVTTMAELIEAVLEDDRITSIGLYLEGMDNGSALGRACFCAVQKGVPVIALKGGDQAAGAAVAASHTASMMVERDLWNAFKQRYGIEEVSSPKALVETLKLLTVAGMPVGRRLSVVSYSGGLNGLAATRCAELKLQLNVPDGDNLQWLRRNLPETVAIANPLDLNIPYSAPAGMISMADTAGVAASIIAFAKDVSDQVIFFIDVPRPGAGTLDDVWCDSLQALVAVRDELRIPVSVAGILPGGLPTEFCQRMQAQGIACLQGYAETMEALGVSARLMEMHQTLAVPPPLINLEEITDTRLLDEAKSKRELTTFGLTIPEFAAVAVENAIDEAERIGYPVVLKVLSESIAHKASVGGVKLNIADASEFKAALSSLCEDVARKAHPVTHVLIEQMIVGVNAEIIIGIKRHTALGFAILIGKGGSMVEQTAHYETLLLPYSENELNTALECLGLLQHEAVDAIKVNCKAVADYAAANKDALATLDVNPIMLTTDGRVIATDALIYCASDFAVR